MKILDLKKVTIILVTMLLFLNMQISENSGETDL